MTESIGEPDTVGRNLTMMGCPPLASVNSRVIWFGLSRAILPTLVSAYQTSPLWPISTPCGRLAAEGVGNSVMVASSPAQADPAPRALARIAVTITFLPIYLLVTPELIIACVASPVETRLI